MSKRYGIPKISAAIQDTLQILPDKPGVYQFTDKDGKVIYVGKAKNLKRRVSSYFHKHPENAKTAVMIRKVAAIHPIIVDNEAEALLLENTLIKKKQPRYNVMLKDDKTYPWICVKNEPFPRVFITRNVIRDGSRYYGPFTSGITWKNMLKMIRSLYKIRTCNYLLNNANIESRKFKVCLEYHIGNCLGPCVGKQSEQDYLAQIDQIERILKGQTNSVIRNLKQEMRMLAEKFAFEQAEEIKERIFMLEKFQAKSTVVNPKIKHVDVFSVVSDDRAGYVNFLKIIDGALVQSHSVELRKKLEETDNELLEIGMVEIRQRISNNASEILVSQPVDFVLPGVKITHPQRGDKKALVDLSLKNAYYYQLARRKEQIKQSPATRITRKLNTLQKDLRMKKLPVHIECFDNSNIMGRHAVAACVVFRYGKPRKSDYRHYNIKTVTGPDDYASMKEIVYRRYRRLIEEKRALPQLIIVDGGKGQLNAAMESIEKLGLRNKITLIGIAKRLEEIYFPDDPVPLALNKSGESLRMIQQIRNEAHRFGITHHRKRRQHSLFDSELNQITGIGDKTKEKLLTSFEGVSKIAEADFEQISKVTGPAKARLIYRFFHPNSNPD
ncbi:MAG: excinuclease ABC subunit C [Bacteroidales bacterium]|nr:excinuclease ABC subunit C [Bacteroidales bacterium]